MKDPTREELEEMRRMAKEEMNRQKLIDLGNIIFRITLQEEDGMYLIEIFKDSGFLKIRSDRIDDFIKELKFKELPKG